MVLIVDEPSNETIDIDDLPAKVWMRFTEAPSDNLLIGVSRVHPGKRVYCLMGASTWHYTEPKK